MQYLLEGQLQKVDHWGELFDIIITSANKPDFFSKKNPFRILNPQTGRLQFHPIKQLNKKVIYAGGNITVNGRNWGLGVNLV
jgi:5'-nucleotidase